MKNRLIHMLTQNWQWKILSLIVAALCWYSYINLVDPVVTENLNNVRVQVKNYREFQEKGQEIQFANPSLDIDNLSLTVSVRARTSVLEDLKEQSGSVLNVWVDPYELPVGDGRLLIHYEINPAYSQTFESVQFMDANNQSYYEVFVEANETVTVPLRYTIIGTPANGYTYFEDDPNMQLTPDEISLTGPSKEVSTVKYAMIRVSVEAQKANVALSEPISYFDEDDNQIYFSEDTVTPSVDAASLYVPIYLVKKLPVLPSFTGEAPEGYKYLYDAALSEREIVVYGQESSLGSVSSVKLPDIDLSTYTGANEVDFTVDDVLNILYPDGEIKRYEGAETITVSFTVEQLKEKTLELPTSQIAVAGLNGRAIQFLSDTLEITVRGTEEELAAIQTDSLRLTANAAEAEPGETTVLVRVSGPLGGAQIVSEEVAARVKITEE